MEDSQATVLDSQTTTRISLTSHESIVAMYPTPVQLYKEDTIPGKRKRVWRGKKQPSAQATKIPLLPLSDDEIEDSDIEQDMQMRKRFLQHPKAIEIEIYIKRKSLKLFNVF